MSEGLEYSANARTTSSGSSSRVECTLCPMEGSSGVVVGGVKWHDGRDGREGVYMRMRVCMRWIQACARLCAHVRG
jgi:hypothetical protein